MRLRFHIFIDEDANTDTDPCSIMMLILMRIRIQTLFTSYSQNVSMWDLDQTESLPDSGSGLE